MKTNKSVKAWAIVWIDDGRLATQNNGSYHTFMFKEDALKELSTDRVKLSEVKITPINPSKRRKK